MTPFPPVPSVLKSDFRWTYGSDVNVHSHIFWHYTSGPPASADLTTFANAISASYTADLKSLASTNVTLQAITVTDLSTLATPPSVVSVSITGTRGGSTLTAETAALINLPIGRRYRGGHPRLYLPMGNGSDLAGPQAWNGSFITAMNSGFAAFVNSLLNVGPPGPVCDHVANVSYYLHGALRTTPQVDTVLSYSTNSIPGSQRRRMGR